MKVQFLLLIFLVGFVSSKSSGQNIEKWIDCNEKVPVEKIYIHLNTEYYFDNDTIWFKVYLMDSRSGQLIPGAENIYINLINANGNTVFESILLCNKGTTSGYFAIPNSIESGNFLLQAYTDYLLNFTNDAWFQKIVSISKIPSSLQSEKEKQHVTEVMEDIMFFPEGGILLEGLSNLVAFKATNKSGYGVKVSGTITDEQENIVTEFKTDFKGMGLFFFAPEPGKKYYARINGIPAIKQEFNPLKEQIKLQLVNHTSKEIIVNIAANAGKLIDKTFYIINLHRGKVLFYQPIKLENVNQIIKFDSQILKPGINRLILLSDELKPISEQLLFSKDLNINRLQILADKDNYSTRSEVKLTINNSNKTVATEISNLSVSVVNKMEFDKFGKSQNILSHLLIDSELNNFFEPSAEFFVDSEISSDAKLRLLMLTNGKSSYLWNSIPGNEKKLIFLQSTGIDLNGIATNRLTGNPIKNGEITLVIQKDEEIAFLTKKTDDTGKFVFPGLLFADTATIHIQAKNKKNRNNTTIIISSPFKSAKTLGLRLNVLNKNSEVPIQLQNSKYLNFTENIKKGNTKIKQPKKESVRDDDRFFKLYESADFVIELPENEESFDNIIDFMAGKIPGVDISGDKVRIRGTSSFSSSSAPLFLLDGIPLISDTKFNLPIEITQNYDASELVKESDERLIQSVKAIPINDVAKIEILKSPSNLAIFGVNGANGVIAIYTRSGQIKTTDKTTRGLITEKIVGYSSQRGFYSPKHNLETTNNPKPDYRTTLYWNPDVITKDGTAEVSFFTSDKMGTQYVIIEGITNKGKICLGKVAIEVSE
ncbi:MAG: TonB-dependent receptor plug domain-containing protein [Draconibacterium sp.]|nr:TonB-dependent receptor plug domain-containing protein [Draconibacterium sp.]